MTICQFSKRENKPMYFGFQNKAIIEDDKLIITSVHGNGTKMKKIYSFDDPEFGLVLVSKMA